MLKIVQRHSSPGMGKGNKSNDSGEVGRLRRLAVSRPQVRVLAADELSRASWRV